jgi:hypothetical protein
MKEGDISARDMQVAFAAVYLDSDDKHLMRDGILPYFGPSASPSIDQRVVVVHRLWNRDRAIAQVEDGLGTDCRVGHDVVEFRVGHITALVSMKVRATWWVYTGYLCALMAGFALA